MFFFASLLNYALLVSTVFAAPTSRLDGGIARHVGRLVSPFHPADGVTEKLLSARNNGGSGGSGGSGNTSKTATGTATSSPPSSTDPVVLTSSTWAGAGMESPTNTYQSVTGTFVVPHLRPATGGASTGLYGGSAWVGLDGITCQNSLMATGINFIYLNETIMANAWTEVYPNPGVNMAMTVNAGDTVKLTVTATSTTTGTAVVENLSNGQSSTVSLTTPSPLCLENAEWIVEDFQEGTFLIPFANFGSITFTDASATTQSGSRVGPSGSGSHLINMSWLRARLLPQPPAHATQQDSNLSPDEQTCYKRVRTAAHERLRKHYLLVKQCKMHELGLAMGNDIMGGGPAMGEVHYRIGADGQYWQVRPHDLATHQDLRIHATRQQYAAAQQQQPGGPAPEEPPFLPSLAHSGQTFATTL
ncbi:hypothetical protein MVEN_01444500 [Mycena venus]|uniref:Concanavalin A-like lectin/glucanase n=1 Tax=Mycena venus TaxID=2733690 RepID=A0A8H6XUQ9_9AGAR|nr:hypothetical protein MVEN_01444500 [Mycena venus]